MNSAWRTVTLSDLPLQHWGKHSYLHRPIGMLKRWRQGSWLMQWADAIGAALVLIVFALAPFVSNTLIGLLLIACAAYWVLLTVTDDEQAGMTPIHLLVVLYWGISVVATALSPVKAQAVEGLIKLTLNLLLFALMSRVLRSPRLRTLVVSTYLLAALPVGIYGVRQWIFGAKALATWVDAESALAGTTRVYSYLGNPNLLAAYLVPAVIFSMAAFFAWKRWSLKALALTMTLVNTYCIYRTYSRGGWLALAMAGFVLLLLLVHWWSVHLPRLWRMLAIPIVLGVSVAVVAVAVVQVEPLRERVASIFAGREDSSNNFRLNVWAAVEEMIRDRPIIGIGPGNDAFNKVYPQYQRAGYTALSAYSIFLEILVETGIVGMGCFLWLLLVTVNQGWLGVQRLRRLRDRQGFWLMAALATMAGMLLHGLVDTVWFRPQISTLWWLMIALIASYYLPMVDREPTTNYPHG
jgi:putative inorganic carbon (HCO3(-)) transporter